MDRAVVLLSGGIDSTVCACLAIDEYGQKNVYGISFKYGQKHSREVDAASKIARNLEIRHTVLHVPEVFAESASHLIDPAYQVPHTDYEELSRRQGTSPLYVPFRNGVFLSIAASTALQWSAESIYYGAHSEDARNWAYPDCTPEFNGSIASAIFVGTDFKVRLLTPLQWMSKYEVVKLGLEMFVPFELTYSCYRGGKLHCGTCPTCVSRIDAFKKNFEVDPVEYEIDPHFEEYLKLN